MSWYNWKKWAGFPTQDIPEDMTMCLKAYLFFSDCFKSAIFAPMQNTASLITGCHLLHRPRQTRRRMHLHEYKIFYSKWKQREVWMERIFKLLNTLVLWKGPLPCQSTKMSWIPPVAAGVAGIGDRGRGKPCFWRMVWNIPGKYRFSLLLLARDMLNFHHRVTHACKLV